MPTSIRLLTLLAAFAFCLPASATETAPAAAQPAPAATAVPATAAEATAAPVAPAASADQPASAAAAKPVAGQAVAVTRVPAGYKTKVVGNETLFCRKDTPLGSRFPTEVCMTQAQYTEQMRNQDSLRQELTGKQKSYSNSP